MKKLLAILCFGMFAMGSANAEYSIGLSGNAGFLDATGKETINGGIKQGDTGATLSNPTGDVLVSSDSTITKYNIVVEFRKEKGFTNG